MTAMLDASRPSIVLATSNGTGMGHLAREAATALALGDRARTTVFSLSQALPIALEIGLSGEYCPSHHRDLFPVSDWHRYLADRICALVSETEAKVFAFDGVAPYFGLVLARIALPEVAFVWVRRALWRPNANQRALRVRPFFDLVLEPGDLAASVDRGATAGLDDATRLGPVTLLEQVDRLPRADAAAHLGLDPARPTALVTLRTDSLDADTAAAAAVRAVLAQPDWQVALTRTPLTEGDLGMDSDRIVPLRGVFPLARYLSAFDAVVAEAGYNSFHEVLHAGLPALLVPTRAAVTDDQQARAEWAAREGYALTAAESEPRKVGEETAKLIAAGTRADLADRCAHLPDPTGASGAAEALLDLADGFQRHRVSATERIRRARLGLRPFAAKMLDPAGVGYGQRLVGLGRAAGQGAAPMPAFTDKITVDELRAHPPAEHLLAGSSAAYRAQRERIAERYYDHSD